MNYETGAELMLKGIKGFHAKFKKMYGQMALRLDDDTYLATGENKLLAGIREEDFEVCDINTGYLGKLFTKLPEYNCFIFGCAQDLVSVSEELKLLPSCLDDIAQLTGRGVAVVEEASPALLIPQLKTSNVCLIKGAGILAGGSNMRKTVAAVQIVAKSCEAYVHGKLIGGAKPIDVAVAEELRASFKNKYVPTNQAENVDFIGFDEESFALRSSIIENGKNLVKKDLVYGSWGSISARNSDTEMLITPSSIDYFDVKIEDVVKVNIDTLEYGNQRVPSSDTFIHAIMYKNLPNCNAIVHTHSNALGVFAACEAGFGMSNPELNSMIGDIKVIPFTGTDIQALGINTVQVMNDTYAAVLAHHGAIFYGPSLDTVMQLAETVEMRARAILGYDKKPEDETQE